MFPRHGATASQEVPEPHYRVVVWDGGLSDDSASWIIDHRWFAASAPRVPLALFGKDAFFHLIYTAMVLKVCVGVWVHFRSSILDMCWCVYSYMYMYAFDDICV